METSGEEGKPTVEEWLLLGFVCPGSYLTLTVEPVLLSVISASDASPRPEEGKVLGLPGAVS